MFAPFIKALSKSPSLITPITLLFLSILVIVLSNYNFKVIQLIKIARKLSSSGALDTINQLYKLPLILKIFFGDEKGSL